MEPLSLSTCMAPNMEYLCRDLAAYLAARLGRPAVPRLDVSWQEREHLLDQGQIDLCWICGLPYVRKADGAPGSVLPLVAPVMAGSRYGDRPVYYSDVVVRRGSRFREFASLRGAAWAYNEPGSHSGYGVVRYELARRGETLDYFGQVVESGAHQQSLRMVLRGEVDGSAIDSTVLEQELADDPGLGRQIRVIDTFGPSPIPPWVVPGTLQAGLRETLREILTGMERDPLGQAVLRKAGIARFVTVENVDYDPIREMARVAGLSAGVSKPK
jgi:phosphonate transport system substrate-binding protein